MLTGPEKEAVTTPSVITPVAPMNPRQRWFERRPIPVWVIFAFASLQMFGIFTVMSKAHYLEQINSGFISPAQAFVGLLYPTLLFLGGLSLFMLRKVAVLFFASYFVWGVVKIGFSAPYIGYLSLALVAGICIYSFRLAQQKRLR